MIRKIALIAATVGLSLSSVATAAPATRPGMVAMQTSLGAARTSATLNGASNGRGKSLGLIFGGVAVIALIIIVVSDGGRSR